MPLATSFLIYSELVKKKMMVVFIELHPSTYSHSSGSGFSLPASLEHVPLVNQKTDVLMGCCAMTFLEATNA